MERVKLDLATQSQPFFIFKTIAISHYREIFTYQIPAGYSYLLRFMRSAYDETLSVVTTGSLASLQNELMFEFFDIAATKARQLEPLPSTILNSPAIRSVYNPYVSIAALNATFPSKCHPENDKILNFHYPENDVLRVDITGQQEIVVGSANFHPSTVDIMLGGYYIPNSKYNGKGRKNVRSN